MPLFRMRARRHLQPLLSSALLLAALFGPCRLAFAAPLRAVAPPGPGQLALEVEVDAKAGVIRTRRGAAEPLRHPLGIDPARIDESAITASVVGIGGGKSVVHVRVPTRDRKDLAYELVASGHDDAPVFAGLTGYTAGSEGDRSGQVVMVVDRDDKSRFLLVADVREDTRICGQDVTPLMARGLDPGSMKLRGATLHRLDKKARDAAKRVVATKTPEGARGPLARILLATGGSAPEAGRLSDGKVDAAFMERRPGDGHGEFATLRTASELPLHALRVTVAPTRPDETGAAPRTFYVATDEGLVQVTMPEDAWEKPGRAYDVPLPAPVRTSCLAFVFDEAYGEGAIDVGVAEIEALTTFDVEGASLDGVAKALTGPRADEAAALLRRAGDGGLAAAGAAMARGELDGPGRALAVDVAASTGTCEGAGMELLSRALVDPEREVRRRALGRIERCGKAAGPSLVLALGSADEARKSATAPVLASVAPRAALVPLAGELGKGSAATRTAIRAAFARAASSAPREELASLLSAQADSAARIDLLRGASARLGELRPQSAQAIAELLRGEGADFSTRYLLLGPLASLARGEEATSGELTRLADAARRDPEWPIRARAVTLAAGIVPLQETLVAAADDPEPRVREAALHALKEGGVRSGAAPARMLLGRDPWTFVRVAAAEALAVLPEDAASAAALARAVDDRSPRVRAAVLGGMTRARSSPGLVDKVRATLDDVRELGDVRAMAARALGQLCDARSVDRLTKLALNTRAPLDEADDQVGLASIEALAAIHPPDLEKRLAPLREKGVRVPVRRAADRATGSRGICR